MASGTQCEVNMDVCCLGTSHTGVDHRKLMS